MNSHSKIVVSPTRFVPLRHRWPSTLLGAGLMLAVLSLAGGLAGCGQKGPLMLPGPATGATAPLPAASTPNTPARNSK